MEVGTVLKKLISLTYEAVYNYVFCGIFFVIFYVTRECADVILMAVGIVLTTFVKLGHLMGVEADFLVTHCFAGVKRSNTIFFCN